MQLTGESIVEVRTRQIEGSEKRSHGIKLDPEHLAHHASHLTPGARNNWELPTSDQLDLRSKL
jgi:hypothetical protein